MTDASISDRRPGLLSRAIRRILIWLFNSRGWTASGIVPEPRRFVLIAAPHTSNWDFLYFVGLTNAVGIRPHFMAKNSLFRWPIRRFLLDMGGVAVDRTSNRNYVQQMIDEFGHRDEFMLTIAPEGTRGHATKWKSGFYHIAVGAGVPMVVGLMDYGRKHGGLGPAIWPSGDYEADMRKVMEVYRTVTPRYPEKATRLSDQSGGSR